MSSLEILEPKYLHQRRIFVTRYTKAISAERPRGYNPHIILDTKSNDKYVCSDCGYILKQPLQSFCGHRFCAECFDYILRSAAGEPVKCKLCVQEGTETEFSFLKRDQTFPDNGVRRELELLQAACLSPGCNWKGSFKEYQNHEPICDYKQVQCLECHSYFKPEELANHKANDCPVMPDRCPHCNAAMTKAELMFHDCDKLLVECYGCKRKMTKIELLKHSDPDNKICLSPSVPCLFGCKEVVPVSNLKTHLVQDLDVHISELERRIVDLEHQLKDGKHEKTTAAAAAMAMAAPVTNNTSASTNAYVKQEIDGVKRLLSEMEAKISQFGQHLSPATLDNSGDTCSQIEVLDRKILIFEKVSAVFKREIDKCGKQIDNLLKDNQDNKDRLDVLVREVKSAEEQGKTNKNQIENINKTILSLETSTYDGNLIWKIDNFFVRRQKAVHGQETSFYSQAFYTSKTGYKACARIYLNGDGMGKNTHVSLFFVLMRGEYDALLPWPFQQKVTMTWLDQYRKSDVVDTFRPDPTSSSFKRPTSVMNIASGCPLFMAHSLLDDTTYGYVKDDVAFIKVTIDTSNLAGV